MFGLVGLMLASKKKKDKGQGSPQMVPKTHPPVSPTVTTSPTAATEPNAMMPSDPSVTPRSFSGGFKKRAAEVNEEMDGMKRRRKMMMTGRTDDMR